MKESNVFRKLTQSNEPNSQTVVQAKPTWDPVKEREGAARLVFLLLVKEELERSQGNDGQTVVVSK